MRCRDRGAWAPGGSGYRVEVELVRRCSGTVGGGDRGGEYVTDSGVLIFVVLNAIGGLCRELRLWWGRLFSREGGY